VILIDSDVLIAHLRGLDVARGWLLDARAAGPLMISAVSVAELTGGMRSAARREVRALFSALRVEPVTEMIARRAGEFMRQHRRSHSGIELADYLIAATADVRGLELATLNTRHYPMFEGLAAPFPLPA
jgi:predicted nucleic acid-binding protein